MRDRVNVLYFGTPFAFKSNLARLAAYADELRDVALRALEEEVVLVVIYSVYHSNY